MALNDWWADTASERFWIEFSGRNDPGVDLWGDKPTTNRPIPFRETMAYTRPGDVVLHWNNERYELLGYSIVDGPSARSKRAQPDRWTVPLRGFTPINPPVSLDQVRTRTEDIYAAQEAVRETYPGPHYLPFANHQSGGGLRPIQGYLAKMPATVAEILSELANGAIPVDPGSPASGVKHGATEAKDGSASGGSAGRRIADAAVRAAIEMHAVEMAITAYAAEGATEIVELGKPYDLKVCLGGKERRVEVKGSTSRDVKGVELTANEVANAQTFAATDLYVVDQIEYARHDDGTITTSGGRPRHWKDWEPAERDLKPSRFDYRLPRGS